LSFRQAKIVDIFFRIKICGGISSWRLFENVFPKGLSAPVTPTYFFPWMKKVSKKIKATPASLEKLAFAD